MTQINVIGNFLDSSGYSVHTRGLVNTLGKVTDVRLSTTIQPGQESLLTDRELEMIKKQDKKEINLIITSPLFWRLHLNAKRNWVYFVWEGDKVPRHFIEECLNPDIEYIFCPSQHTRDAILNTVGYFDENKEPSPELVKKIKIISHGVDLGLFYKKEVPKEKFTFILNKGWRNNEDRGGSMYGVQAYLEEFTSEDNVELIVKINPAYGIPNINALINELKPKDKTDFGMVNVNTDSLHYNVMVDLYNKGDVFLMPTRAESFGLPGVESMACGVPVLATGYGGQIEYIKDKENGLLIDYDMTEVVHEIQYENIRWATPKIEDLRKKMRWCYENQDKVKKLGLNALESSKDWTWDKTALLIKDLI